MQQALLTVPPTGPTSWINCCSESPQSSTMMNAQGQEQTISTATHTLSPPAGLPADRVRWCLPKPVYASQLVIVIMKFN